LSYRDDYKILIKKSIIKEGIVAPNNELGEMISNDVLCPCLVLDLQIKLLKK